MMCAIAIILLAVHAIDLDLGGQRDIHWLNSHTSTRFWPQPSYQDHGSLSIKLDWNLQYHLVGNYSTSEDSLISKILKRYINQMTVAGLHVANEIYSEKLVEQAKQLDDTKNPFMLPRCSAIYVHLESNEETLNEDTLEQYTIKINAKNSMDPKEECRIDLFCANAFSAVRAFETLFQMPVIRVGNDESQLFRVIERVPWNIVDKPRYQHRGVSLDTARHYMPVKSILQVLDGMVMSKLNVFHWHMTDSHSFPFASEAVPLLAEKGAYSKSRVYTHNDVKAIVQYAKERAIRVIPEFDIPGHTYPWGLAYPDLVLCPNEKHWYKYGSCPPTGQLNPVNEETYRIMEALFTEIAALFPDARIHFGADEVNMSCWEEHPDVLDFMKEANLTSGRQVLAYFLTRVQKMATEKLGKKMILWEDSVIAKDISGDPEFLSKDRVIVQVWRDPSTAQPLLDQGYDVLCSFYSTWYLDIGLPKWVHLAFDENFDQPDHVRISSNYYNGAPHQWQQIYINDPGNNLVDKRSNSTTSLNRGQILGGEVSVWSEVIDAHNLAPLLWPRADAAAETLWSDERLTRIIDRGTSARLDTHISRKKFMGLQSGPIMPELCSNKRHMC